MHLTKPNLTLPNPLPDPQKKNLSTVYWALMAKAEPCPVCCFPVAPHIHRSARYKQFSNSVPHPPLFSLSGCLFPLYKYPRLRPQQPDEVILRQITELIVLQALEVLLVEQNLDTLLDIGNLGHKTGPDLVNGFGNELLVLHLLAGLHDADNGRLGVHVSI